MWSTVAKVRSVRATPHPRAQGIERLRRRHLVDEVQANEYLRLSGRERADGVGVPYLLQKRLAHVEFLS
jgi:hypothetical protein